MQELSSEGMIARKGTPPRSSKLSLVGETECQSFPYSGISIEIGGEVNVLSYLLALASR
jgi:hypothetical protein